MAGNLILAGSLVLVGVLVVGLCTFTVWALGGDTPAQYAAKCDRELQEAQSRLSDVALFAEHDRAGIAYVIRGDKDVELCRLVLASYRRGHVDRGHVEQLFRQMRKDLSKFPPVP